MSCGNGYVKYILPNRAIIDLVGDIAGFRPGNKVVIFESSESASFDASLAKRLFPEFSDQINTLSGDNKYGVQQLCNALEKAVQLMALPFKVYAITDRDSADGERPQPTRMFEWNAYHIENYLLDEKFIAKAIRDFPTYSTPMMEPEITRRLEECARESLGPLLSHEMHSRIRAAFERALDLGFDPSIADLARGFSSAVGRVQARIQQRVTNDFSEDLLRQFEREVRGKLESALRDGSWRTTFKGRDILRRFAGEQLPGLPYEAFRDAIVARMADSNYQPAGMVAVIRKILED